MLMRFERFPVLRPSFGTLFNLEKDIDDLLGSVLTGRLGTSASRFPALNVAEYENQSVVLAELPGVSKDQVKISLDDGVLTISGERKMPEVPENSRWIRNETLSGQFSRSIRLPHQVKTEEINAELKNGLLRVTLPKAEEARPREISIK